MLNIAFSPLQSQPEKQVQLPGTAHQQGNGFPGEASGKYGGEDKITLSQEGQTLSRQQNQAATSPGNNSKSQTQTTDQTNQQLTTEEQRAVQQLKQRDLEVRAHEMAHLSRAGQYAAGGMSFSYQKGPDGKRYAIGGEVPIDTGKERTPEATIQKMQAVKQAALAPANPSGADRRIAAASSMKEAQARQELQAENAIQTEDSPEDDTSSQAAPTDAESQNITPEENTHSSRPLSVMA